MPIKKLLLILSLSSASLAFAAESAVMTESAHLNVHGTDLSQYIAPSSYAKVNLSESFGQLISESQILSYQPDELHKYYRDKVCEDLFGWNCKYNLKNIKQYTGVDLKQESGLIGQSFSQIDAHRVIYTSLGMDKQAHPVSGAILIPQGSEPLKGVVLFYHFTVLNKTNIPSNFAKDEFKLSKTMASTLASDGYAVVMPDYLGMGSDESAVHPYVIYPEVNALSGIYMLDLLKKIQPNLKYKLVNNQIPLYISGYSEGGAYALWAAKILQDNKGYLATHGYSLIKTVPMEGAYNLSKVTLPFLLDNSASKIEHAPYYVADARIASFTKPGFVANVLNSYAHFHLNDNESAVFSTGFSECKDCEIKDQAYNLAGLLQSPAAEIVKYKLIYKAANETGYSNSDNSILPLTNVQLLKNPQFIDQVEAADIYNWRATTPINFLTLEYDSNVTRLNSETAYSAMAAQGSSALSLTVIPNQNYKTKSYMPFSDMNIDHPSGLTFMLLFARNQFDESSPSVSGN